MRRYAEALCRGARQDRREAAPAPEKLDAYAALYADVLSGERMCLCGMLAAEYETLPPSMQAVVLRFFDDNERWLEGVLEEGRRARTLSLAGSARDAAPDRERPRGGNARRAALRRRRALPHRRDSASRRALPLGGECLPRLDGGRQGVHDRAELVEEPRVDAVREPLVRLRHGDGVLECPRAERCPAPCASRPPPRPRRTCPCSTRALPPACSVPATRPAGATPSRARS